MNELEKGEILFSQGRLEEAEALFLGVLKSDPTNIEALNDMGVLSHSRGDTAAAIKYFQEALSTRKDYTEAILNLVSLHQEQDRWDISASVVESGLEAGNGSAALWNLLATIYLRLSRKTEARNAFMKSLEIDPRQEDVRKCFEALGGYIVSDTIWHYKKFRHQKYPQRIDLEIFKKRVDGFPPVTKETAITSMGSCFARNIAEYLLSHGYNYLVTETPFKQASAHWDQVFNTSSMRQIFEYSFTDSWHPIVRWWPKRKEVQDPFRRDILYPGERCDAEFEAHREASRKALGNAELIILTLGLVEVWRDRRDKMTFYRVPSPNLYDPAIHEFYVQSVEDCLEDLSRIHALLRQHNPNSAIIVTVSPVPLFATFRSDVDVITANTFSKSTLRVAAERFALQHENVCYFPSFEIVTQAIPDSFEKDNRHVAKNAIDSIMDVFEARHVAGGQS